MVSDHSNGVHTITYYDLSQLNEETLQKLTLNALRCVSEKHFSCEKDGSEGQFIRDVFDLDAVVHLLVYVSQLAVFSEEFSNCFKNDLDILALMKKLKYYNNLPVKQVVHLIHQLLDRKGLENNSFNASFSKFIRSSRDCTFQKFKDFLQQEGKMMLNWDTYRENEKALETMDPHAVYPTSKYRQCNGLTLASEDRRTIEAVMSTCVTTTIKITKNVLSPKNKTLINVYLPIGRCVAIIDDKVYKYYGRELQNYFDYHKIELLKLVHGGDEVDKDIKSVEKILVELKSNGVARNEPILIIGGGVIADIGGFASALYHRNTPYVMLCTSLVSGIDAGPSPRTCCDGFGFKNLYGSYHPPILTLTDRCFFKTLHEGWVRHGIAEVIKMAVVKDRELFELIEKAGPKLIRTKFGTVGNVDEDFEALCDLIICKALEDYVSSEYGNLWETHQCRPHAYGHTWSPGYELPSGMLHGHAISTCMGYGAYLAKLEGFITNEEFDRILNLLSSMELSLWHDIMNNHDIIEAANDKVIAKRGGNLCAPVPKRLGHCGYINELPKSKLSKTLDEYKKICSKYPRQGRGIDVHCIEVGLQDPSTVAGNRLDDLLHMNGEAKETPLSYDEWIQNVQMKRNEDWELNVMLESPADTENPPDFGHVKLFHDGVEHYARAQTSLSSKSIRNISSLTEKNEMFTPCMVGTLESQFLKMQCLIKNARKVLDVGTFTGMSALAMAEGLPANGEVVTLECSKEIAQVAQQAFDQSPHGSKIKLHVGKAKQLMEQLAHDKEQFDIIFLDADKENYITYYNIAMDANLLAEDGIIIADNVLCALLYDKSDCRSQRLHEFNQHIKNDPRVEQVVLTIREGISIIRRKA